MDATPNPNPRQRPSLFFIAAYAVLVGIATASMLVVINVLLPASFLAHGAMQTIARERTSGGGQDLMKFLSQPETLVSIANNPRMKATFSEFGVQGGTELEILKKHLSFEPYPKLGSNAVQVHFEANNSEVAGNGKSAVLESLQEEWERVFHGEKDFRESQRLAETLLNQRSRTLKAELEKANAEYKKAFDEFESREINSEDFANEMQKIGEEIQAALSGKTGEKSLEKIHSIINDSIQSKSPREIVQQLTQLEAETQGSEGKIAAMQKELEKRLEKLKELKILRSSMELGEKESRSKSEERRRKRDEEKELLNTKLKERIPSMERLMVFDTKSKPLRRYFFQPRSLVTATFVGMLLGGFLGFRRGWISHESKAAR